MRATRTLLLLASSALTAGLLTAPAEAAPATAAAPDRHCAREGRIDVPGAEVQETACLDDLTTAGTSLSGHTNTSDWEGLHASGTPNPSGVPGIQVDGYFPDGSATNTNNGWNHDSQFVLRVPDDWNGGLVVSGAPGVRRQYANDFVIGDRVLARGFAFASTDKGNTGTAFYDDGSQPGGSIREWHRRVTQLARAAKVAVEQRYGRPPAHTYMAGISNGGYLVRWQLENRPGLYDGGLDWEGSLFRAAGPNLLTYLPTALREYPTYAAGGEAGDRAERRMLRAGFEPGSQFLWEYHYGVYWDLTQRIYREELDPSYDGDLEAGVPFCQAGTPGCDADYDYAERPRAVRDAVRSVQLTGEIKRPLLTVHGTLDTLLPPDTAGRAYERLVRRAGAGRLHRSYEVEDGTHVDSLYTTYPGRLRPLLPCATRAFDRMVAWVEDDRTPPAGGFVERPRRDDLRTGCSLQE
ncbi:tannase/feruloyl esterase family alpha/beta hydrolase [Nocardioides sp. CFH 31398]|uniref:tannase/feruloyl esterase family alpha/beta hydrolase n=1 Tax=Nocardioides sp. CFH 31398 TaxID=2919579 RepID=UPI001F069504|nr:tannase/feruloyl esterase family alpha/beta hydrolase [Nocardioides sp. CFH 31398]MCH1867685.1 tannase/feruloyl esterase family alpha/beta hydrolase [Nocardioides sp. CFH 31398]